MNIKFKGQIMKVILLLCGTMIGLNLLIDFKIIDYYTNQIFQQILVFGIILSALFWILAKREKYRILMFISQLYFLSLCITFYYSYNVADFVAATVCFYVDVKLIAENIMRQQNKNGGEKHGN